MKKITHLCVNLIIIGGKKCFASGQRPHIVFTKNDIKIATEMIKKHLGPEAVSQSYLNSNTNSCEAHNRRLSKHCPKNITHGVHTLEGRVAASVFFLNEGFEGALTQSHIKIGRQVSAEVKKSIHSLDVEKKKGLERQKKQKAKESRCSMRANKVILYEAKGAYDMSNIYEKGIE